MDTIRVVIADPNPVDRLELTKILGRLGHDVVGESASSLGLHDLCRSTQPDLIITEMNLPAWEGLETLRRVQEELPIPAIIISCQATEQLIDRAAAGHVFAYLTKPIREEELAASLAVAVSRARESYALVRASENVCRWFG
jgi:response regulator NasT